MKSFLLKIRLIIRNIGRFISFFYYGLLLCLHQVRRTEDSFGFIRKSEIFERI